MSLDGIARPAPRPPAAANITNSGFPNNSALSTADTSPSNAAASAATGSTTEIGSMSDETRAYFASLNPGEALMLFIAVLLRALATNEGFMNMTAKAIDAGSQRARDSQQAASIVDGAVSAFKKPDATADVPKDVLSYLQNNNISIGLKTNQGIDAYLVSIKKPDGKGLNKGELDTIKGALEADSGRNGDVTQAASTKIQRLVQTFNILIGEVSSITKQGGDAAKGVIHNM